MTEALIPPTSPSPKALAVETADDEILFIEIVEGRELVSMDSNGYSDPYVVVLFNDKKVARTTTKKKTLNPVWKESFTVDVPKYCTDVVVECWDWDMLKRDDRMGLVRIPLDSLLPFNTSKEDWYTIKPMREGDMVSGAIHLKLSRFSSKQRVMLRRSSTIGAMSPLFMAVESNDLYSLMTLTDDPKININEQRAKRGDTALHVACSHWENEHIMLTLLKCESIRADLQNSDGNTVLHLFCSEFRNPNCSAVFEGILARGGDVNAQNRAGETPLHRAVLNTSIRLMLVERLLAKGADPCVMARKGGAPIHYAAQLHRPDIIGMLIERAPQGVSQLELKDSNGLTPAEVGDEAMACRMRAYKALDSYLESLPDWVTVEIRKKIFQQRLFIPRLRAVTEEQLRKIGVDSTDLRKQMIEMFSQIEIGEDEIRAEQLKLSQALDVPATPREQLDGLRRKNVEIKPTEVEFTKLLGEGSSAKVYKGIYKDATVAIKVLTGATDLEKKEFCAEYDVVSELESLSPYIIRFFGVTIEPDRLSLLEEFCELGSLYHVLTNESLTIRWQQTLTWIDQMLRALLVLHSHKPPIFHRDLKSLNLLIKSDMTLKMADFGLSRFNTTANMLTLQRIRGTYAYIAPELFYGQAYTAQSDVYSIGIIIWELVYRCINQRYQRPYAEFADIKMDFQIILKTAKEHVRPTIPTSTPPLIRNMIQLCVMPQQDGRPECESLVQQFMIIQEAYKNETAEFEGCIVGGRS